MRFQIIDEPNASTGTSAYGISNTGEIVGLYSTNIDYLGFSDTGGNFSTMYGPLIATTRQANGVNATGQIVGVYEDSFFHAYGFVFSGGSYTTLNDPNASNQTSANGINDAGQIVGWYTDASFHTHGFKYSNGTYTDIDVPGIAVDTAATGINASGQIVGYYHDGSGYHGFLDVNGTFTTLNDPLATNGTYATGINDQGQIIGYYYDSIGSGVHNFRYSNGVYTSLDVPIANGARAMGINDANQVVGWYSDGLFEHGFEAQPNIGSDFNGNGTADVLWRNSNGALIDWAMNGSAIAGSSVTYQGNVVAPDSSWSIGGTSDFSGDGRTDVLWRQTSGALVMWQMNGPTVSSSNSVTSQGAAVAPDGSWSVAGAADFNGDGKADILWRQNSGALALWQMNGSSISASNAVTSQGNVVAPDASWNVAGIADFNSDGKTDILWRNSSGALALWQMDGSAVMASNALTCQGNAVAPDASWNIAGIGDFNGDGSADLVWRSAGGALALWQMNGSAVMASGAITSQGSVVAPDASWKIVEIGDFNGDGSSDIMWRNDNGTMSEWLMNGSQITSTQVPSSQGLPAAPDQSWTVQSKLTSFG